MISHGATQFHEAQSQRTLMTRWRRNMGTVICLELDAACRLHNQGTGDDPSWRHGLDFVLNKASAKKT